MINAVFALTLCGISLPFASASMAEVPHAGEGHRDAQSIGGSDDILILYGAAGLDDRSCAGFGYGFKAVWEGEEGVGGGYAAFEGQDGLHGSEAGGVYAAHLACAYANGLAVTGIDDGVRFNVLADAPGEEHAAHFFRSGRSVGDDLEFGCGDAARVGVLEQCSTGDVLDYGAGGCRMNLYQSQIFLG
jgi:hypothetical protein